MKLKFSYIDGGIHPKIGHVFHWQRVAINDTDSVRYSHYLCGVLGAVAQSISDCDRLLGFIDSVEHDKEVEIETGRNDVTLTLNRSGVQVDINLNEEWIGQSDGHFTLVEWRKTLDGWRRFLEMPQSLESVVELEK